MWGYLGPGIAATTVGIGFAALLGAELVAMRQRTQCVFDFDPVRAIPVESCTRAGPDLTAQVALGAATLGGLALGVPLMARGIVGAETPRPPLQPESPWAHLGPGIASTLIGAACLPALVWASQPAICSNDLRSGPCRSDEQLAVRITLGITAFGHLGVGVPMIVRGAVAAANSHKGSEPPAVTLRPVVGPTQFGFRGTF